jgi:ribbon-helix-helix CopG family protein
MKEEHLTLRLPGELARALARWARAHRVPKSHAVREAVANYLAPPALDPPRLTARELASRWRNLPRLSPEEATEFADDIAAARGALPRVRDAWE